MVNLPESLGYVAAIQGLSTNDPLEGGTDGALNIPNIQLASRTKWLKDQLEAMAWRTGDIKEVACDAAYIAANFDGTGLGTGERVGWAICNGQNGTVNKEGRVGIGYLPTTYPIGSQGGNKDAVVVGHRHRIARSENNANNGTLAANPENAMATRAADIDGDNFDYTLGRATGGDANVGWTNTVGESGTNKNMQPYLVVLYIQKI